jgi:hypothetical protein
MPPGPTAPCSLAGLLAEFRPCFTAPTFQIFIGLVVGLIAQARRRTVCGMLTGAGLDQDIFDDRRDFTAPDTHSSTRQTTSPNRHAQPASMPMPMPTPTSRRGPAAA